METHVNRHWLSQQTVAGARGCNQPRTVVNSTLDPVTTQVPLKQPAVDREAKRDRLSGE